MGDASHICFSLAYFDVACADVWDDHTMHGRE